MEPSPHEASRKPGIEEEVRRHLQKGEPFAFAYIDIDHFKAYNDSYGYEAGDHIIKEVADSLIESVASRLNTGFPGHIGGDDFVFHCTDRRHEVDPSQDGRKFDARRLGHYRPEDRERA